MNLKIYSNIGTHILRSKVYSIYERHVPSQEKPRSTSHTFLNITIWRNNIETKIKSISYHQMAFVTIFPMSQEFCNSDYVWESYANFSKDPQTFLCKNGLLLCCCEKTSNQSPWIHFSTSIIDYFWMCLYTH